MTEKYKKIKAQKLPYTSKKERKNVELTFSSSLSFLCYQNFFNLYSLGKLVAT